MKYSEMTEGIYIIRTRELPWAKVLSGAICYVVGVNAQTGEILIQLTEDCVPVGNTYRIPEEGDDGCWHDVSILVSEANHAIAPPENECMFSSITSANYRNYLGLTSIQPLIGQEAEGSICLLGEQSERGLVFSRQGFWVIAYEDSFYIAYQGYCDFVPDGVKRKLTLRVLNLGNRRQFYPAEVIVNECEKAIKEDTQIMHNYEHIIQEESGREVTGVRDVSDLQSIEGSAQSIQSLSLG